MKYRRVASEVSEMTQHVRVVRPLPYGTGMMKKLLALVALAGTPGCCVAGATIGGATHPQEPEHSQATWVGFAIGLAVDVATVVAVSQMRNPGVGFDEHY